MTWSCHVCGDVRPDSLIGIHTRYQPVAGTAALVQENIRYCTDRPECVAGARTKTFYTPAAVTP